jgi:2-methylfumaryl-CoA isomerase
LVGNLARIAEAQLGARDQHKDGCYPYGAFGHDFVTQDDRRVMIVALTARQWHALVEVTGTTEALEGIERATGHDFDTEGGRLQVTAPATSVGPARGGETWGSTGRIGRLISQSSPASTS